MDLRNMPGCVCCNQGCAAKCSNISARGFSLTLTHPYFTYAGGFSRTYILSGTALPLNQLLVPYNCLFFSDEIYDPEDAGPQLDGTHTQTCAANFSQGQFEPFDQVTQVWIRPFAFMDLTVELTDTNLRIQVDLDIGRDAQSHGYHVGDTRSGGACTATELSGPYRSWWTAGAGAEVVKEDTYKLLYTGDCSDLMSDQSVPLFSETSPSLAAYASGEVAHGCAKDCYSAFNRTWSLTPPSNWMDDWAVSWKLEP